jgi:DNA-binding helix-hairpin-helix protein with protein kinase domain
VNDVRLAHLAPFEEIGDGGQGTVYRLPRSLGWLLKKYHAHIAVNPDELELLIGCPAHMTEDDQSFVQATTAWPVARVFDDDVCVGFLMAEAPARFGTELAGREVLRELQYLVYKQRKMWNALRLPSPDERRVLVQAYVHLFQVLHRYGVVIGDVSMRNLLWTLEGTPGVYAIDCDGFRLNGRHPAVPQAQTPEWADPTAPSGLATFDSDRYKLALLITRVLLGNPRVTPEDIVASADLRSRFAPAIMGLLRLAVQPGHRPPAEFWMRALEGRPTLTFGRPQPPPGRFPHPEPHAAAPPHPGFDTLASSATHRGPSVHN